MTDRELLQQALDTLRHLCLHTRAVKGYDGEQIQTAIDVLKARLAQPEPEPFEYWNAVEGWVKIDEVRQHFDTANCGTIYKTGGEGRVPLYTVPQREWVGLTDEEVSQMEKDCLWGGKDFNGNLGYWAVYRAIEAKLKEKNA